MRQALRISSLVAASLVLTGCSGMFGSWFGPQREAWRTEAENQCLASGRVKVTPYVQPASEVDGPGNCGADRPFRVSALAQGSVGMRPTASLNCPMTAAIDDWVERVVQPMAMQTYGQPVAEVKVMASYGCRRINNRSFGSMSEHAYMNALDVGGFAFADGTEVTVKRGWRSSDPAAVTFLQGVGEQSCSIFNTVIGPDGDANHQDHFHLDLANRRSGKWCKGGPVRGGNGVMSYAEGGQSPTGKVFRPLPKYDPENDQ